VTIYKISYCTNSRLLERSAQILQECALTLSSLLKVYRDIKGDSIFDHARRQDLLTAMFSYSVAGLDSVLKQGVRDSLNGANLEYDSSADCIQSPDEFIKITLLLDISIDMIVDDIARLDKIFLHQNKILQETDLSFEGSQMVTNYSTEEIIDSVNYLIEIAENFLKEIDRRLKVAA